MARITVKQKQDAFIKDLLQLCAKHDLTISGTINRDGTLNIEKYSEWNATWLKTARPSFEIHKGKIYYKKSTP
jgi:hypothetical protein